VNAFPQQSPLVLAAAGARLDGGRQAALRTAAAGADWSGVIDCALACRLGAVAAINLSAAGVEMPGAIRARFEEELLSRTAFGLAAVRQARDVQARLTAAGVPSLVYKGPALAVAAYGHVGARALLDLDVLVPRPAVAAARDALAAAGYRLDLQAHRLAAVLPAAAKEDHFHPPDPNDFVVELHVAVVSWALATRFDTAAFLDRAVRLAAGEGTLVTLSPEDHLLVVAAHATGHDWREVRHASEIDGLVRGGIDWGAVRERAERTRVARMLRVGLLLARDAFGTPLPPGVADWIAADREAPALAQAGAAEWFAFRTEPPRWPGVYRTLRYRERATDKARFVVREQITSVLEKFPWERWRPPPRRLSSPTARS
jgi:hypothetical protein